MPFIIDYLLKVSIALAVVFLFYQLVLRRLTFYNWNRWYLVGYSLLCFFIPFMNITDFLFRHELQQNNLIQIIPSLQQIQLIEQQEAFWNAGTIMLAVFTSGVLIMGIRVLLQLVSLNRIKTKATLLNSGEVKLYHINESIVPFSFHDAIYINKEQHTEAELKEIIRHEFVHVKQKHSIDILLAELLCIILWFNPVAWLLRKAIRQNLEFIADHKVLEEGLDKKQYQYLLLKVVGNSQYSITPKFNFSSLKNRIAMMNKMKSARVQIIRFLFVLPLIAVLLLAFREVKLQERKQEFLQPTAILTDTVPTDNISSVDVTKENGKNNIRIVLKDGTVENYDLNDAKQKAAFEKKYGELKPPPPPPAAPSKQKWTTINSNDIETVDVTKKDGKNTVSIRLKNGTVETYDLNDPKQKETLEKKYGTTTTTPPPPPPPVETLAVISPAKEQLTPNEKGYYLTIADNNGECVVIVKDKKKKIVEALTLTDWNKKETFYTNKYGDIPPPPPPVPVVKEAVTE
ncbi:MAG: M56 family metallopeptidase [Lacibacter sp.]